jgi:hypothetical protein
MFSLPSNGGWGKVPKPKKQSKGYPCPFSQNSGVIGLKQVDLGQKGCV